MDFGRFLIITVGWLDLLWIYNDVLLGICFPLRVTSRKSTHFLLASMVIFKPYFLKIAHKSFLINSTSCGDLLLIPRPSSLSRPKLLLCFMVIS